MDAQKTSIERAFEMANTGAYRNVNDLKRDLGKEGYDLRQIDGRQLMRQLAELLNAAKNRRSASGLEQGPDKSDADNLA